MSKGVLVATGTFRQRTPEFVSGNETGEHPSPVALTICCDGVANSWDGQERTRCGADGSSTGIYISDKRRARSLPALEPIRDCIARTSNPIS